jgi:glycosyltransferase involved in cell wall biosynthesis
MSLPARRDISILIPAYNEIEIIAKTMGVVGASLPGLAKEIIVVDDGSNDGTRVWLADNFKPVLDDSPGSDIPASRHAMSPECIFRVIFHSENKGKGSAIQTAMRASTGSVLVIQGADLEYDPDDWDACIV